MAKINLAPLTTIHYTTTIPVSVSHLNYGNHLGHDALVSILHEARVRFLASLGYSELKIEDAGLILRDLTVQYKAEAFYGDELQISIEVAQLSSCGFELHYQVDKAGTTQIVARAQTTMVCFDYATHKIMKLPGSFARQFANQTPQ
ncbi:acyl-CoA thioesterase [Leeia oryzae]|uniref:acyl-CoA thioesterase n=1 Tax=Leeia oryzae TaxID=356662 RepID=UPI00036FE773|nr:thioesterase family protein [Leeia oryzae]